MRARYSRVKSAVKPHSSTSNSSPQRALIDATLSAITTVTLSRMSAISHLSNSAPARVSASKMMV